MSRIYHISNAKIILQGDTYPIKEDIKKRGGRWDGDHKYWWLEEKSTSLEFLSEMGFLEKNSLAFNQPINIKENKEKITQPQIQTNTEIILSEQTNEGMSIFQFVSLIGNIIKRNLGEKYWIYGEISSLKSANGHVFFDLVDKDEKSIEASSSFKTTSVPCALWAGKKKALAEKIDKILLQDGTKIKILVSCDFRKEGSRICAIVEDINEQYTQGDLLLQRLAIVRELKKRGLYDKNKKLKLPEIPLHIALITAKTSRAASDFLNELSLSRISFRVTLYDCNMQGEKTSENVCSALRQISDINQNLDCIVITRGGGSRLDLRWFDDLEISKQIAYSSLPVIVAVGHFEDLSIADEVAFLSEKTPTAAARYLCSTVSDSLLKLFLRIENLGSHLLRRFTKEKQNLVAIEQRFAMAANRRIDTEKKYLKNQEQIIRVFKTNISQTLQRGFALAYDENNVLVTGKDFLKEQPPQNLKLKFAHGFKNESIFVSVGVKEISKKKDA